MKRDFIFVALLSSFAGLAVAKECPKTQWQRSAPQLLNLVDQDGRGFALYRYWLPEPEHKHQVAGKSLNEMEEICFSDLDEVYVLDGTADHHEANCSSLRKKAGIKGAGPKAISFNQDWQEDLSPDFLRDFETWITKAKENHKKLGIRCTLGLHRTGRLVAYYEMKYKNATGAEAKSHLDAFESDQGFPNASRICHNEVLFPQVERLCMKIQDELPKKDRQPKERRAELCKSKQTQSAKGHPVDPPSQ